MKRIAIIYFFIMVPLMTYAQSDSLRAAYQQVCTTLKEYKFEAESVGDCNEPDVYSTISLKVKEGNLIFTVNVYSSFGGSKCAGDRVIRTPISDTKIIDDWGGTLKICNYGGLEMSYRGSKDLIKCYRIRGTYLTVKKLIQELDTFCTLLREENFQGSLGYAKPSPTKITTKSKPATSQSKGTTKKSHQNPKKRVPAGN